MTSIEKITNKIKAWTSLLLSLAERVQLIRAIICSIQSFWSNHFLLPTAVHQEIQSTLTRFLWKGNINDKGGAKVCWDTEEGGLGIKSSLECNQAQILSHLLKVISKAPNLWATWVNATVLKRKYFWTIPIPTDCS